MQKQWIKVAVAAVALFVLALILIPFLVNAETFRPKLQDQLSAAMGRQITLGHLSLSLLRGSLVAENITIADDPAFSSSPFVEAKSLSIGVELGPLLLHHQVRVTKLTVESPTIHLISKQNGVWNFSNLGNKAASPAPESENDFPDLDVGEFDITGGTATVASLPASGEPFSYTEINLKVQQFSFLKSFPFQLSSQLPGAGAFSLNGNAGPISPKNAANTPFSAILQLKHFDPLAAGVTAPASGISLVLDLDAQLASDGTTLTSNGKIQAARLQLSRFGSPAPNPIDIDYVAAHDLDARAGKVSDMAILIGSTVVHVNGSYRITPQAILLDLHLDAPSLPVDQLEELLPSVGVKVPRGSSLKGGTITTRLAVSGPASEVTLTGPVEIDNTQLAGFDLGSKIEGLTPFGANGSGTSIQTLRADVNSTPQATELTKIYANLPQIGSASGNGVVSPSGSLDFNLTAKFNPNTGVGAIASQAQTALGNLLGGFSPLKSRVTAIADNGIPLTISGTAANPLIRANLKAMLK